MIDREPRTYIYIREDGKCVHVNAAGPFVGEEYEHDDVNWNPPDDWPYEVHDMRQKGDVEQWTIRRKANG